MARISRRPKSRSFISSESSSPTSKSGSVFMASDKATWAFGSVTSLSSTMIRFLQISRSPLSIFTMISKLSDEPNLFESICLNTSSRMRIMVSRSMFLNSLNSEKVSTKLICSILLDDYFPNLIIIFAVFISVNGIIDVSRIISFFCFLTSYSSSSEFSSAFISIP